MRAATVRAQSIERGDTDGRSEIAVAPTPSAGLGEREADLAREPLGQLGQADGAGASLHRRSVDAAADAEAGSRELRLQVVDGANDPLRLRGPRKADVDFGTGVRRDDIGPRAAVDHADIDGGPGGRVAQRLEGQHLLRQLLDRTDPFLRLDAGMGGAALDL